MAKKLGQPEISIGLVGHVDHGKTTLTERLSGKWTDTHSEEIKRGITIRLGYADLVIYKAEDGSLTTDEKKGKEAVRKISFVDAPGHESLMATMLCGATIIDGALLLIAANEPCPLPQTREHLTALEIIGVERVIVVQNKVDLVSPEDAKKNHQQIAAFLAETPYKDAPIIPISAQHGVNMDFLLQAIQDTFPTPKRDAKKEPLMFIARSFDINKPGTDPRKLQGGILGGALRQGVLKIGDTIGLSPGHMVVEKNKQIWKPLTTKITGITTGGEQVKQAGPGGSIGVMTELDPAVVKADSLTGCLVGRPDKLPPVWYSFTLETHLLERVVGSKDDLVVEPIKRQEMLMLNVNAAATVGIVSELGKNQFTCSLKIPVCADPGSRVTISRRVGNRFRLIGFGIIKE
ncbi:translation initiation factor IF-2 subunit gamma [Candidatus Woesearchaeota archaeon CG1_02_57_44]|nr:MAG: translation initiation factor IF-2 subunit gamma [Candidatus Woesearchaeota archaeon CG1_02_57_44]